MMLCQWKTRIRLNLRLQTAEITVYGYSRSRRRTVLPGRFFVNDEDTALKEKTESGSYAGM